MSPFLLLDTETTSLEKGRLVQLAYKNLETGEVVDELFKPPVPIDFEAMAVHHITESMVSGKPAFETSDARRQIIQLIDSGAIVVAHNAKFDIGILANEGVRVDNWICTQKLARHAIQEVDIFKLQYLRYAVLKNEGLENIGQAHDALADILVLEVLFKYLLNKLVPELNEEALRGLVEISRQPSLLRKMTFGKYAGMPFHMLRGTDRGYLQWMRGKPELMADEDLKYTVDHYLQSV